MTNILINLCIFYYDRNNNKNNNKVDLIEVKKSNVGRESTPPPLGSMI